MRHFRHWLVSLWRAFEVHRLGVEGPERPTMTMTARPGDLRTSVREKTSDAMGCANVTSDRVDEAENVASRTAIGETLQQGRGQQKSRGHSTDSEGRFHLEKTNSIALQQDSPRPLWRQYIDMQSHDAAKGWITAVFQLLGDWMAWSQRRPRGWMERHLRRNERGRAPS
jgi:hypothetical protein